MSLLLDRLFVEMGVLNVEFGCSERREGRSKKKTSIKRRNRGDEGKGGRRVGHREEFLNGRRFLCVRE